MRAAGWVLVVLLLASPFLFESESREDERGFVTRLLGPVSTLAARVQWIRVQDAVVAGEHELALARAETALTLDPGSTSGWRFVGTHLGLHLGSHLRELDGQRRLALVRAALETLTRGEELARDPGALAEARGMVLWVHAEQDPELPWPGGARELWREAALAFERAAELGRAEARDLALTARVLAGDRADGGEHDPLHRPGE